MKIKLRGNYPQPQNQAELKLLAERIRSHIDDITIDMARGLALDEDVQKLRDHAEDLINVSRKIRYNLDPIVEKELKSLMEGTSAKHRALTEYYSKFTNSEISDQIEANLGIDASVNAIRKMLYAGPQVLVIK